MGLIQKAQGSAAARLAADPPPFPVDYGTPVRQGWTLILGTVAAFALWSVAAPLSSAVIAPAEIVVEGARKPVQHLDGGTIAAIHVADGQDVRRDQVVLELDGRLARAGLDMALVRRDSLLAQQARLEAERDGAAEPAFDPVLVERAATTGSAAQEIEGQRRLFAARAATLAEDLRILDNRIAQSRQQIAGLEVQRRGKLRQAELVRQELEGVRQLRERGYATGTRVLALEREVARLEAEGGETQVEIARVNQAIQEAELQKNARQTQLRQEVETDLRRAQLELGETQERVAALAGQVERLRVVSPADGTVLGLMAHSVGGVIAPGATVMEIVPRDEPRVVEARIAPGDVDAVAAGMPAELRFPGLPQRDLPRLTGTVARVSADRLTDPRTGAGYFTARVVLDPNSLSALTGAVAVVPGMPAEIVVARGSHTLMDYLVHPVEETVVRALRE